MKTNLKNVMAIVAVLVLACSSAHAVLITNGATTLVSDGFESYPTGATPPAPWIPGPYAAVGTTQGGLVDNTSPPGAYEGSNYLHTITDGNGAMGETLIFANQTSGTVKLTFMLNTVSNSTFGGGFSLSDAGGARLQVVYNGFAGWGSPDFYGYNQSYLTTGGVRWVPLGIGWADNVWRKIELEYTFGSFTGTLKVDGVASAVPVPTTIGFPLLQLNQLDFFTGSTVGVIADIDAVPEPATMVLLSLGGLGLLRRRK